MNKGPTGKIVLRLPDHGLRWIVHYDDLAIFAQGEHNFTLRVPIRQQDACINNAKLIYGPLFVFKAVASIFSVGSKTETGLTVYELGSVLRTGDLELLQTHMRTLESSSERLQLGRKQFQHQRRRDRGYLRSL